MGGSCWWGVLVLAAVSSQLGLCRSLEPDVQEEVSLTEAVELFNQRDEGELLYKLLSVLSVSELQNEMEGDSPTPSAAFLIKETECPKAATRDTDLCDYKQDGEVKVCGLYPAEDQTTTLLNCVSMTENLRTKRASENGEECGLLCKAGMKLKSAVKKKLQFVGNVVKTVGNAAKSVVKAKLNFVGNTLKSVFGGGSQNTG
ncbi:antimicrobial protein CAP18-like isoform X2 [Hyperolius riggenbachi]|uniref:antimicrobial protein CAP18-like isoform X2 n=1 Tax=Hyperolius riggenbachi TaxID=752182 RepID=UPI0035A26E73